MRSFLTEAGAELGQRDSLSALAWLAPDLYRKTRLDRDAGMNFSLEFATSEFLDDFFRKVVIKVKKGLMFLWAPPQ